MNRLRRKLPEILLLALVLAAGSYPAFMELLMEWEMELNSPGES